MTDQTVTFKSIDLVRNSELCVAFRRDSFICSFGVDNFFEEAGPDGVDYLERLQRRIAKFPDGYVHVWQGNEIIGQLEMQIKEDPQIGYVNLFYLVPEARGTGAGELLQQYAMQFFLRNGLRLAQLSVSPKNERALAYYRKHGWRDLGTRPGHENVNLMECVIPSRLEDGSL